MAVDRKKLEAIIGGRARAMCSPEYDRKLNEFAGRTNTAGGAAYDPNPSYYDYDADKFDAMYSATFERGLNETMGDLSYTNESVANSNLPEHIKQSLMTERIDVTGSGGLSVLDNMNIPQATPRKQVTERRAPAASVALPQTSQSIDYSIIKAIFNECLNEHFSKQMLSESTSLQTIALKEGTISLVDNKGNVYKAKLEKIGNKNDKK